MTSSRHGWEMEIDGGQVLFGEGSLARLGELARGLDARRVLLVTDRGLRAAGHVDSGRRALVAAGIAVDVYDGVEENPTEAQVAAGADQVRRHGLPDAIVGLGGGSSLDFAKALNFVLTGGGRMRDYHGFGKARAPLLPAIGVPTTAGTGSEAQSYALISRDEDHVKMACGDRAARFRAVILDPALTLTAPAAVTAATGIDALTHAVESYVTTRRNPISQMYAREAWRRLEAAFGAVLGHPGDLAARGEMLLGSHLAGLAIEHSMLGAAHACANPLTARFGVVHGIAVGLMLPAVMRFNRPVVGALYDELGRGGSNATPVFERVSELRTAAGLPSRLRECGIPEGCLPELAGEAARQWTGGFNPRPAGETELGEIYADAY